LTEITPENKLLHLLLSLSTMKSFPATSVLSISLVTAMTIGFVPQTFGQFISSPLGAASSVGSSPAAPSAMQPGTPSSTASISSSVCDDTCTASYNKQEAMYVVSRNTDDTIKSIVFGPASAIEADKWIDAKELAVPSMIGVYSMATACNAVLASGVQTVMPCENAPSAFQRESLYFVRRYLEATTFCPVYGVTRFPIVEMGPLTAAVSNQSISDDWNILTANPPVECQNASMSMYIH